MNPADCGYATLCNTQYVAYVRANLPSSCRIFGGGDPVAAALPAAGLPYAAPTPLRPLTDLLLQTETAVSGTLAPAVVAEAMARQWMEQTGESS